MEECIQDNPSWMSIRSWCCEIIRLLDHYEQRKWGIITVYIVNFQTIKFGTKIAESIDFTGFLIKLPLSSYMAYTLNKTLKFP